MLGIIYLIFQYLQNLKYIPWHRHSWRKMQVSMQQRSLSFTDALRWIHAAVSIVLPILGR